MKFILLLLVFIPTTLYADCSFLVKKENVSVSWKAFKTPAKIGVGGKFTSLGIANQKTGKSLKELVRNTPFNIDIASTDTGDKARDNKIVNFFFGKIQGKTISGEIVDLSKGVLNVAITMNKVTKVIPLKVEQSEDQVTATGYLDILDFMMTDALKGINEACKELHQGKTWSDVELNLSFKFQKSC